MDNVVIGTSATAGMRGCVEVLEGIRMMWQHSCWGWGLGMLRPRFSPRNLTISASHWRFCSRTATCAREQITAARRVSLRRLSDAGGRSDGCMLRNGSNLNY
ncbi:hypothetical protein HaLaN_24453 [Haematococcus lacustris]|uniref:Uncharacterized protein n=1 Tax=Haematococcus lacustris TaxID=44745 RepID=A0A699ZV46_HAELA|nr:hypothetical protein HaLaN_24453 [Haematococcus lacustris]